MCTENIEFLTETNEKATRLFNSYFQLLDDQQSEQYRRGIYDFYAEDIAEYDEDFYILFNKLGFVQSFFPASKVICLTKPIKYSFAQKVFLNPTTQVADYIGEKVPVEKVVKELRNRLFL